jgi:hypothetical protein
MSSSNFTSMASKRYPITNEMSIPDRRDQLKWREAYIQRLEHCKLQPAYHIQLPGGDLYPCLCEPLMEDDAKGWQTVKRKSRVKKVWTNEQLDEEADLNNWDDVEHYGRATYTNVGQTHEHNGALFDIGSRF